MSRAFEDAQEIGSARQTDEHVARELGISIQALSGHPYEIEENIGESADNESVVYGWRILWDDMPPEGVLAHGDVGSQWSLIQAGTGDPDPDEEQ